MALHHAFKTAALHHADGVDEITGREQRRSDDVAGLESFEKSRNSRMRLHGDTALLLDMTEQGLGEALFLLVIETELDEL